MAIFSVTNAGSDAGVLKKNLVARMTTKIKIFSTRYEPEQKTVSGIFILYRNTNKLLIFFF